MPLCFGTRAVFSYKGKIYEYNELDANYHKIIKRFHTYLKGYIDVALGATGEHKVVKYRHTTLKYFHKELGI